MREFLRQWLTGRRRPRILAIDDFLPDPSIGAGAPRAVALLRALSAAGAAVTLWPVAPEFGRFNDAVTADGTVIARDRKGGLGRFLARRGRTFDAIVIARPHNMATLRKLVAERPGLTGGAAIVYDAEALFAERDILRCEVLGAPLSAAEAKRRIDDEVGLTADADVVLAVSARTAQAFAGHSDVRVLGYPIAVQPAPDPFAARDGFLFVGPTYSDATPNTDSVVWFADHVLPRLRAAVGDHVWLKVAGATRAPQVRARWNAGLMTLGVVPDIARLYARARVFVAPTRFAAGIPLKVYDAAAHGLPAVVTPLLAHLLDWTHEQEILVAESPEDFAAACLRLHQDHSLWERLRANALARVAGDCDVARFDRTVADLVADVASQHRKVPRG
jgi:O-antigen biosynthesis protein